MSEHLKSRALWRQERFGPLFFTQFLGAFNDNFFKNALVILITFQAVDVAGIPAEQMVAMAGAIFILPYFLFSATAGQIADKLDKARLIRATKTAEIGIMLFGAAGLWLQNIPMLFLVLFFMGLQSTVFGPVKYSILPQHLAEDELLAGNALVEMGTYLAILLGTLAGGWLVGMSYQAVAVGVVLVAILGRFVSGKVPSAPPADPNLKVNLNPIGPTIELIRLCRQNRVVWLSIQGISWFWCFGAMFLNLFPPYTKDVLHGTEHIATLFLALFSVGIGIGSMLCERLSRDRLELGLVPIGSLGMSLFTFDLWLVGEPFVGQVDVGLLQFFTSFSGIRIAVDLLGLSAFGGFLIVPLYTLIQQRSKDEERARIIAGNNVLNALWMVTGSVLLTVFFQFGFDVPAAFLVLAVLNLVAGVVMYTKVPEFMLRFCTFILSNLLYRVSVANHSLIPKEGGALVVCNHVSFIDWFILAGAIKRPVRFVMYKGFFDMPVINFLFRQAGAIPIAGYKEDPKALEEAFDTISKALEEGWVVGIFPEGRITDTGEFYPFKSGMERIIARDPVPVVPVALNGLWGSFFSRKDGSAMTRPFRRGLFAKVAVSIGEPVSPEQATAEIMEERVRQMWSSHEAK